VVYYAGGGGREQGEACKKPLGGRRGGAFEERGPVKITLGKGFEKSERGDS